MSQERKFKAYIPPGRRGFAVTFDHPLRKRADGRMGKSVTKGLGTRDAAVAEVIVEDLRKICSEPFLHDPHCKALTQFDRRAVEIFFDGLPAGYNAALALTVDTLRDEDLILRAHIEADEKYGEVDEDFMLCFMAQTKIQDLLVKAQAAARVGEISKLGQLLEGIKWQANRAQELFANDHFKQVRQIRALEKKSEGKRRKGGPSDKSLQESWRWMKKHADSQNPDMEPQRAKKVRKKPAAEKKP